MADGGEVTLEWCLADDPSSAPVVLMLHGLCGSSQDFASLLCEVRRRGWSGVVMNRRGHRRLLSTPCFSIMGSTSDVREAVAAVRDRLPGAPVVLLGSSAGSGLAVRYLGEEGERAPVAAALIVDPAYELEHAFGRIDPVLDSYMTKNCKSWFVQPNAAVLARHAAGEEGLPVRSQIIREKYARETSEIRKNSANVSSNLMA